MALAVVEGKEEVGRSSFGGHCGQTEIGNRLLLGTDLTITWK